MQLRDFDKIDALNLEILYDADLLKIDQMLRSGYLENPLPAEPEDFEQIDVGGLDDLLEDQTLISDILSLWQAGYAAEHIALELNQSIPHINRLLRYIKKNISFRDEDLLGMVSILHAKSWSTARIGKFLGIPQTQVIRYLPVGASEEKLAPTRRKKVKVTKKVIRRTYSAEVKLRVLKLCEDTEMSYAAISKVTGVNRITVNRWCKEHLKQTRRKAPLTPLQREEIRKLCKNTEMPFLDIGKRYGVSAQAISRTCKGIREPRIATTAQREMALDLMKNTNLTNVQIAEQVGVSDTTIRRWRRVERSDEA